MEAKVMKMMYFSFSDESDVFQSALCRRDVLNVASGV